MPVAKQNCLMATRSVPGVLTLPSRFGLGGCHVIVPFVVKKTYLGVSLNGGTPKTPQSDHF